MTKFVGRRGSLGIAKEATKGVAVNPTMWLPYVTMSFKDITESAAEEQGMGNIADQDSIYVTFKAAEGSVEAQLYDQALGYLLASCLGAAPSSGAGPPYTHTYTLSQVSVVQTLSLYWTDPDRDYMFPNAVVESIKLKVEPKGIVSWTVGFKSKTARNWTTQTPDFTTLGAKWLHQHLAFKLAANVGAIAAATPISLKDLELTIDRKSVFDEVIGTVEPEDILSQALSIEGSLSLNLEDDTYRNYMLGGTYRSMEVKLNGGTNSILTMQFPRVSFTEWEPDFALNDIAKQKINFKANYDSANALQIISTCTLVNTKSSY